MPDSQNPEHVRKLIKEFQLKGANLIPTVTGEIVPIVLVADLARGDREDDRPAIQAMNGAASGAGKQNRLALGNPNDANVLLLVDTVTVWQTNADVFMVAVGNFGAGTPGLWRDHRMLGNSAGVTFRVAATAAVLDPIQYPILAATAFVLNVDRILTGGEAIWVQQENQNETLHAIWTWRERTLPPGD